MLTTSPAAECLPLFLPQSVFRLHASRRKKPSAICLQVVEPERCRQGRSSAGLSLGRRRNSHSVSSFGRIQALVMFFLQLFFSPYVYAFKLESEHGRKWKLQPRFTIRWEVFAVPAISVGPQQRKTRCFLFMKWWENMLVFYESDWNFMSAKSLMWCSSWNLKKEVKSKAKYKNCQKSQSKQSRTSPQLCQVLIKEK